MSAHDEVVLFRFVAGLMRDVIVGPWVRAIARLPGGTWAHDLGHYDAEEAVFEQLVNDFGDDGGN
jgi:hypothetical protein